jgi:hypothetical protein
MHENDRRRPQPFAVGPLQIAPQHRLVQRPHHGAIRVQPLVRLDDRLVKHLRQHHVPLEQPRPVLIRNPQRIAKPLRRHQQRALALALQQRIGRHCRPHLHAIDQLRRHRLPRRNAQQLPYPRHRRIAVLLRILRQHLRRRQAPIGLTRHDVGKRTPTVNPELPFHENAQKEKVAKTQTTQSPLESA